MPIQRFWRGRRRPLIVVVAVVVAGVSAMLLIGGSARDVVSDEPIVTASASAPGSSPAAVIDGSIGNGAVKEVWRAPAQSASSWLQESWEEPFAVGAIQIVGPPSGDEGVTGSVLFSDGTRIPLNAIAVGSSPLTTVAISPRSVTWAKLELTGRGAAIGEFRLVPAGTEPPQWPVKTGIVTTPIDESNECSPTSSPIGSTSVPSGLALVCPATGTAVVNTAGIVVLGPPGGVVTAFAWLPRTQTVGRIASATLQSNGRGLLQFPTGSLSAGPFAVKLVASGTSTPLYVQLFNRSGATLTGPGYAPRGMTLVYSDDFDGPLSVSARGAGTRYAALKPDGGGGQQFGSAVFEDPALGHKLISTESGNLVISTRNLGSEPDPLVWGRSYSSGILSSMRVGGSGFSAQRGYFEARILAPAGTGTWPAFWMLNSQSSVAGENTHAGEVDAVELYGHNPLGSCHTLHNWPTSDGPVTGSPSCLDNDDGATDWALNWHVYGVRIRAGGADFFIDGKKVASKDGLVLDSAPYFFMVDLALGGGWPVDLTPTGGVVSMYVDWIHVYTSQAGDKEPS